MKFFVLLVIFLLPLCAFCQLSLNWQDNSNNELGFKIERSVDSVEYNQIATVGANVTDYVDSGLDEQTRYWYKVRAYNDVGDSDYTNVATKVTNDLLKNGPFDRFTNGLANDWAVQSAGGTTLITQEDTGRSYKAQKVDVQTVNNWGMFFYQTLNLQLNQNYKLNFWYKTNNTENIVLSVTNGPHSEVVFDEILSGTNGQWTEVTKTFLYNNLAANTIRIASNKPLTFWVDDMSLLLEIPQTPDEPSDLITVETLNVISAIKKEILGLKYIDTNSVTIDWEPIDGAVFYEVRLVWIDQNIVSNTQQTANSEITFNRPRAGHFIVEVRTNDGQEFGPWINSTDFGWFLYWELPAPGGIIIE